MTHIQIDPASVREEPSVAGRLIMTTVVQIQDTPPLNVEHLIANAMGEPGRRMFRPVLIDQQAVLSFEPEDPIEHDSEAGRGSLTSTLAFQFGGQQTAEFIGLECAVFR